MNNAPETPSELWLFLQKEENPLMFSDLKNNEKKRFSFETDIRVLPDHIAVFVKQYKDGDYRGLLRDLDRESPELAWMVILKVLCLLRLAEKEEKVGEFDALEFLRDRVLPQIKQLRAMVRISELFQYSQWLERFCLGYELPSEFWEAL